jgi:hypothetical protein
MVPESVYSQLCARPSCCRHAGEAGRPWRSALSRQDPWKTLPPSNASKRAYLARRRGGREEGPISKPAGPPCIPLIPLCHLHAISSSVPTTLTPNPNPKKSSPFLAAAVSHHVPQPCAPRRGRTGTCLVHLLPFYSRAADPTPSTPHPRAQLSRAAARGPDRQPRGPDRQPARHASIAPVSNMS